MSMSIWQCGNLPDVRFGALSRDIALYIVVYLREVGKLMALELFFKTGRDEQGTAIGMMEMRPPRLPNSI
jgi:hypothetical protein